MGEWIDTPYGRRYKEDYGNCEAFFKTEPDEGEKRMLPSEVTEIITDNREEDRA